MCIYIHICTHTHTYILKRIHACMHTFIQAYIVIYIHESLKYICK